MLSAAGIEKPNLLAEVRGLSPSALKFLPWFRPASGTPAPRLAEFPVAPAWLPDGGIPGKSLLFDITLPAPLASLSGVLVYLNPLVLQCMYDRRGAIVDLQLLQD